LANRFTPVVPHRKLRTSGAVARRRGRRASVSIDAPSGRCRGAMEV